MENESFSSANLVVVVVVAAENCSSSFCVVAKEAKDGGAGTILFDV